MAGGSGDVFSRVTWREDADLDHLHLLVGDWQLLADLSFADLVLWVETDDGWRAAAQVRPTTGVSMLTEDLVETRPPAHIVGAFSSQANSAVVEGVRTDVAGSDAGSGASGDSLSIDIVPVRRGDHVIAWLSRHSSASNLRRGGRLETRYLNISGRLLDMVASGQFPDAGGISSGRGGAPRVGDGVIELDEAGQVIYASPNAVSAARRLGVEHDLSGQRLAGVLSAAGVEPAGAPEEASAVLAGRAPWHVEMRSSSASVTVRGVPLLAGARRSGAALLLRDITELRRRDRELLTKDATIREIHHRVKNNLQTVAALLRLQGRRVDDEQARRALADAGRRVAVIAAVHESLSAGFDDAVDFDEVAARSVATGIEVARASDVAIRASVEGSFGVVASEDATSLALILGELVQNAVEHGLATTGGCVVVEAQRDGAWLQVSVEDDGRGFSSKTGTPGSGLGTQIVRTFVQDMRGTIEWKPRAQGGTRAQFTAYLNSVE